MKDILRALILIQTPASGVWLRKKLNSFFKNSVIKSASTEKTFFKLLASFKANLIIIESHLKSIDLPALLRSTKKQYPFLPIIIITNIDNEDTALKYLSRGADDYVLESHLHRLKFTIPKLIQTQVTNIRYQKAEEELKQLKTYNNQIKEIEKARDESEKKYNDIIQNMLECFYMATPDGKLEDYNREFPKIFGLDPEQDHRGMKLDTLWQNKNDRQKYVEELIQRGKVQNYRVAAKKINGEEVILQTNSRLLKDTNHNMIGIVGTFWDVTEIVTTEKKLRHNESLLEALLKNFPENIYFKDNQSRFIRTSMHMARLFGGDSTEFLKDKTDFDIFNDNHAIAAYKDEQKIIKTGKPIINLVEKEVYDNGVIIYVSTTKLPLRDHKNQIIGTFGISRDITNQIKSERKLEENAKELKNKNALIQKLNIELESRINERTEELHLRTKELEKSNMLLKKSRKAALSIMQDAELQKKKAEQALKFLELNTIELKKLSRAIDKSPVTVVITDRNGIIEYVNPQSYHTTGYTINELVGKKTNILRSGYHSLSFYKKLWGTITAGKVWTGEFLNKKKNGDLYWENASISPISDKTGKITHFVAVREEITERKKIEQEQVYFANFQSLLTDISSTFININVDMVDEQIDKALKEITSFVQADTGYVFMFSEDKHYFSLTHAWSSRNSLIDPVLLQNMDIEQNSSLLKKLLQRKTVTFQDIDKTPEQAVYIRRAFLSQGVKSIVAVPMVYNRNVVGYLGLNTVKTARVWKNDEINLLNLVASIFTNAINRKQSQDELLREKKFTDTVLLGMPGIFYAFTNDGKFIRWNENFEKFTGYTNDQIVNMDLFEKVYKDDIPLVEETLKTVVKKGYAKVEARLVDAEGNTKSHFISGVSVSMGDTQYIVGSAFDISDRLKMERELKESKEIAEAATQAKSQFLAVMSHEIRTPMNAIIGFTNLVKKTQLNDKQIDYINKIDNSAQILLGIIDDILDFSKIEAGKLELESIEFELNDVLHNLSDLISVKAQEKNIELIFKMDRDVPLHLIGDPLRLEQVLLNLTNNAIKFTEMGEIIVHVELLKQESNNAIINFSVSDTGIGIDKSKNVELFQPFIQGEVSTSRRYGGAGLGLSISRHLVNLMGGDIEIKSEPGKGSTFSFTIYTQVNTTENQEFILPSQNMKGIRILLVDDNNTVCNVIANYLDFFSFKSKIINSADKIIPELEKAYKAKSRSFDLIIVDWKMPGMNGNEVTHKIKLNPDLKKIPIIIMIDSLYREEATQSVKKPEIDGYLVKPVTISTLFDVIMEVFGFRLRTSGKSNIKNKLTVKLDKIRGAQILLVEDNEVNQQVAIELLESEGFWVDVAKDGKQAIDKILRSDFKQYDLVLMDIQMPVIDGYEATKYIRKDDRFNQLPILAMTADAVAGVKDQCLEAGMNDYITKPIKPEELFKSLVRWIQAGRRTINTSNSFNREFKTLKTRDYPQIKHLDIRKGIERLNGNVDAFIEIVFKFRKNNHGTTKKIKEYIDSKNFNDAEALVHSIKGVSGNISATSLFRTSQILDQMLKHHETEKIIEAFNNFKNTFDDLMESISGYEAELADKKNKIHGETLDSVENFEVEKEKILPLILKLNHLVNENNIRAKEVLRNIQKIARSIQIRDLISEISSDLERYNFTEAKTHLKKFFEKHKMLN